MIGEGLAETEEQIAAVLKTEEWQRASSAYGRHKKAGHEYLAAQALKTIRERWGDRLAEGLAEWWEER